MRTKAKKCRYSLFVQSGFRVLNFVAIAFFKVVNIFDASSAGLKLAVRIEGGGVCVYIFKAYILM